MCIGGGGGNSNTGPRLNTGLRDSKSFIPIDNLSALHTNSHYFYVDVNQTCCQQVVGKFYS